MHACLYGSSSFTNVRINWLYAHSKLNSFLQPIADVRLTIAHARTETRVLSLYCVIDEMNGIALHLSSIWHAIAFSHMTVNSEESSHSPIHTFTLQYMHIHAHTDVVCARCIYLVGCRGRLSQFSSVCYFKYRDFAALDWHNKLVCFPVQSFSLTILRCSQTLKITNSSTAYACMHACVRANFTYMCVYDAFSCTSLFFHLFLSAFDNTRLQ